MADIEAIRARLAALEEMLTRLNIAITYVPTLIEEHQAIHRGWLWAMDHVGGIIKDYNPASRQERAVQMEKMGNDAQRYREDAAAILRAELTDAEKRVEELEARLEDVQVVLAEMREVDMDALADQFVWKSVQDRLTRALEESDGPQTS